MRTCDPSERDLAIFRAFEFGGESVPRLAEATQLPVDEVHDILANVRAWYELTTLAWAKQANPQLIPLVAARLHEELLRDLLGEAMQAWHRSQGPVTTTRNAGGQTTTTTTTSCGQTRYLLAAMRLSSAQVSAAVRLAKIMEKLNAPPAGGCAPESEKTEAEEQEMAIVSGGEENSSDKAIVTPAMAHTELRNPVRATAMPGPKSRSA